MSSPSSLHPPEPAPLRPQPSEHQPPDVRSRLRRAHAFSIIVFLGVTALLLCLVRSSRGESAFSTIVILATTLLVWVATLAFSIWLYLSRPPRGGE